MAPENLKQWPWGNLAWRRWGQGHSSSPVDAKVTVSGLVEQNQNKLPSSGRLASKCASGLKQNWGIGCTARGD